MSPIICWLFGHRDRPHYSATPRRVVLGVHCGRCLRVRKAPD